MKVEAWSKVKVGDFLIYADTIDHVHKAKVVEIDIKIETFEPAYKVEQPYGLTAETGNLRIEWTQDEVPHTALENLANLIRFNLSWYDALVKLLDTYTAAKTISDAALDVFISKRANLREL